MPKCTDGHFEVVWPRGERRGSLKPLAPRTSDLSGLRIVQLWDYLFKGDRIFLQLEQLLRERFPGVECIHWREIGNIHGNDEQALVAQLGSRLTALGAVAAISGLGC